MIEAEKQHDIDYIDCSGMCTMLRCPARFLFRRLLGLQHPDANNIHVDYGTDIHAALPHCYRGMDGLDAACDAFNRGWASRKYGNEDSKRNILRARASLINFIENHTPSICPYKILPIAEQIAAPEADRISDNEVPFAVDIGGSLPFLGRIDLPVEWKATGHKWTLDYKTASEISDRYFNNFYRSPQAVGYTLALSTMSGGDIKGMIIEAVRVSGAKDMAKAAENKLSHVWVTVKQMDEFMVLANQVSMKMITCNEKKKWPKMFNACGPYSMFGQPGFFCEYSELCDADDWRDLARTYNRKKPFHPFKIKR